MALLARYGLAEYWLIDPTATTRETYVLRTSTLILAGVFSSGDRTGSAALPGLSVSVERLFDVIQ